MLADLKRENALGIRVWVRLNRSLIFAARGFQAAPEEEINRAQDIPSAYLLLSHLSVAPVLEILWQPYWRFPTQCLCPAIVQVQWDLDKAA